ncbi:hypothetical protein GCM10017044_04730 [Kordiimonas sediminis]|uniref:DUF3240 domain-containing protein n=1 Tax=Kordiimonas sediminis TaxID=1735581 RepID=A0A919E2T5_9PROT|nr:DUF3240 family protein [Kordiimonas sediminis]GHF13704.1 hypothetical protein GCM10017044_04730 [Kordiimonas sediminis]
MTTVLLSLNVSVGLEEAIVDWLLESADVDGFKSQQVSGHGSSLHKSSALDQVMGRDRRVELQIILGEDAARRVISSLKDQYTGANIFYAISPVLEFGSF